MFSGAHYLTPACACAKTSAHRHLQKIGNGLMVDNFSSSVPFYPLPPDKGDYHYTLYSRTVKKNRGRFCLFMQKRKKIEKFHTCQAQCLKAILLWNPNGRLGSDGGGQVSYEFGGRRRTFLNLAYFSSRSFPVGFNKSYIVFYATCGRRRKFAQKLALKAYLAENTKPTKEPCLSV